MERVIRRNGRLHQYQNQLNDLERHWSTLQRRIARCTLAERKPGRNGRERQHIDAETAQRRLDTQRVFLRNRLGTDRAVNDMEEHDLFASIEWVIENCKGGQGCISFSPVLTTAFREASEIRELVETAERESVALREELTLLETGMQQAVDGIRRLTFQLEQQARTLGAYREWRDEALRELYLLAQATMLGQDIIAPVVDMDVGQTMPSTGPPRKGPQSPKLPPLDPKDVADYEFLHGCVFTLRGDLDGRIQATYGVELAKYLAANPDATASDFGPEWADRLAKKARQLSKMERLFMKKRDKVMEAGGDERRMADEGFDIPGFSGKHPQDGKIGCASEEVVEYLRQKAQRDPKLDQWLRALGSLQPEPLLLIDEREQEKEEQEQEQAQEQEQEQEQQTGGDLREDTILPWESASYIDSRPRQRERIDENRRDYERGSDSGD